MISNTLIIQLIIMSIGLYLLYDVMTKKQEINTPLLISKVTQEAKSIPVTEIFKSMFEDKSLRT